LRFIRDQKNKQFLASSKSDSKKEFLEKLGLLEVKFIEHAELVSILGPPTDCH